MTTETISNHFVSKDFSSLDPLFENWFSIVNQYSELHPNDEACYWYNERATLSTLAAAAWRTEGWCALEEYQTKKRRHERLGRCDLYLATEEIGYECEAKQSWQQFETGMEQLSAKATEARKAAGELDSSTSDARLALTFWSPSSKFEVHPNQIEQHLENLRSSPQFNKNVAQAWIFPEASRKLKSTKNGRYYPGVVLLVDQVQRSPK